jgi:uncharacterized protein with HEPN domain
MTFSKWCRKIRVFTEAMSFEEFEADVKTQDAVIRNFEIIGEAAKRLPDEFIELSGRKSSDFVTY